MENRDSFRVHFTQNNGYLQGSRSKVMTEKQNNMIGKIKGRVASAREKAFPKSEILPSLVIDLPLVTSVIRIPALIALRRLN